MKFAENRCRKVETNSFDITIAPKYMFHPILYSQSHLYSIAMIFVTGGHKDQNKDFRQL